MATETMPALCPLCFNRGLATDPPPLDSLPTDDGHARRVSEARIRGHLIRHGEPSYPYDPNMPLTEIARLYGAA